MLKHTSNASRPTFNAFACLVRRPVVIGRTLLMLVTISLLTMPLTQRIWTWDHFLRGGQDFETAMLMLVMILCLAVLLSQLCRQYVESLFAACSLLAFAFNDRESAGIYQSGTSFFVRTEPVSDAATGKCSSPLKI